jgi:hypothetical protein
MPVILATQEAEIRRTAVQSQPRQIVHEPLSRKNPSHTQKGGGAGGVIQGVSLELKKTPVPHTHTKMIFEQRPEY